MVVRYVFDFPECRKEQSYIHEAPPPLPRRGDLIGDNGYVFKVSEVQHEPHIEDDWIYTVFITMEDAND